MSITSNNSQPFKPFYNVIMHLHPRKLNESTLRFNLTFGLGGMSALLFVLLVFSGLLLKFHYTASPAGAYQSILDLQSNLLFGQMLRNMHHWSSILLLWITVLHMLRVFFTSAYRHPRHNSWIFGMILLILIIFSNFTGYLLPWDQLSYWAVTISTGLLQYIPLVGNNLQHAVLGGKEVGQETLTFFYNLHTGILPTAIVVLMGYHFWHIRKAGGVIVAEKDKDAPLVDTQPHLIAREFVVAMVLLAVVFLLSALFDAPLREPANPTISPNPVKAPWYFMGLQEMLIHFDPFFTVVVIPVMVLWGALKLPFINFNDNKQGIWFVSPNGKKTAIIALVIGFIGTLLFVLLTNILPDPKTIMPSIPTFITKGILPFAALGAGVYGILKHLKKRYNLSLSEYVQSMAIILLASYAVLTIIGIFFRGAGMILTWPWLIN